MPAEARKSPVHFLLFGYTQSAEIRTTNGVTTSDESGSISGFEFLLSPRNGGFGLHGRMLTSDGGPNVMEGGLLIGSRRFSIDLAYMMRDGFNPDLASPNYDSTYAFARGGFRSRANLGNTGFTVGIRGGYYIGIPSDEDPGTGTRGVGRGESARLELVEVPADRADGLPDRAVQGLGIEQETSALTFGGGSGVREKIDEERRASGRGRERGGGRGRETGREREGEFPPPASSVNLPPQVSRTAPGSSGV